MSALGTSWDKRRIQLSREVKDKSDWLADVPQILGTILTRAPCTALRNANAVLAPDTVTRRRERIAGIHGINIETIELYERNMIDELALRLMHGELPVGS